MQLLYAPDFPDFLVVGELRCDERYATLSWVEDVKGGLIGANNFQPGHQVDRDRKACVEVLVYKLLLRICMWE